ncbi:hypothetical protein HELRODRAFT_137446, partial [Helobdella robusta]|uniref:J domain-containing protein n=1 Tax=Helobdella robusta TaxID=6412 RepID=T1EIK9_HELRO
EENDYYDIVGCNELSSKEQIQTEYRKKAKELHPDKNLTSTSDKSFKELLKAKETLCDAEKRLTYDNWRKSGLKIPFEVWKAMNEN